VLSFLKKAVFASVITLSLSAFGSGDANATTLAQAIELALENNPQIGIVARNREAVAEELRQARGLYLPTVDVSAGIAQEQTSTQFIRGNGQDDNELTATDASVSVVQRLFTGFEVDGRVARQKARIKSAANTVYENSEVLALDVIGAYLEVIRQRELLVLSRENVGFHVDTLDSLVKRLRGGVGSRADVTQTQARLALSRSTFVQTNNALADAEALYTRLVGQYPGDLELPTSPASALPSSIDELVRSTTENNPTVKITEADVEVANADVSIAEAEFYPTVTLEGNAAYDDDADGVESYTRRESIGLRVNWNLFNGGIDRATRQEMLFREEQSKSERYNAVIEAQEEARVSWYAYVASQQTLQELSTAVVYNQQTRDSYEQQFQVGQRTLLDVLDAENELFTSRGQLISADINQMVSAFRMLATSGRLLKTLDIQAPEQSNTEAEDFWQSVSFGRGTLE
jgi:adhesin transport system outer membrane protein